MLPKAHHLMFIMFTGLVMSCGLIDSSKKINEKSPSTKDNQSVKSTEDSSFALTLPEIEKDQGTTKVDLFPPEKGPYNITGECLAKSPLQTPDMWIMQISLHEDTIATTNLSDPASLSVRQTIALEKGCSKAQISISGLDANKRYFVTASIINSPIVIWNPSITSLDARAVYFGRTDSFRLGDKVVLAMRPVTSAEDQDIEVIFPDSSDDDPIVLLPPVPCEEDGIVCGQPKFTCPGTTVDGNNVACPAIAAAPSTYPNMCALKKEGADFLYKGKCKLPY